MQSRRDDAVPAVQRGNAPVPPGEPPVRRGQPLIPRGESPAPRAESPVPRVPRRVVVRAALAAVGSSMLAGAGCAADQSGSASGAAPSGPSTGGPVGSGTAVDPSLLEALEAALRRLAQAYARADRGAWIAAARPPGGDGHAGEDYDLMRSVGVSELAYGPVRLGDGVVASSMSYRFAGIDWASATAETRWDPSARPPARLGGPAVPWEEPGTVGLRRAGAVVLAAGAAPSGPATPAGAAPSGASTASGASAAAELMTHAEAAAATVGRVWGGQPPALVLTLPRDAEIFARWAADTSGLRGVPAVTVGPVQQGRAVGCDRIVVHPGTWHELSPQGRRVVITHEATHVVLRRDAGGPRPLWLEEGYCEYVAYARAELPESTLVAPLLRQIRRSDVPARLPQQMPPGAGGAASAAPSGYDDAPAAYAAGLLACRIIAERAGEEALTLVVRAARGTGEDAGVTGPLREATGWTLADLHHAWSARVRALVDS